MVIEDLAIGMPINVPELLQRLEGHDVCNGSSATAISQPATARSILESDASCADREAIDMLSEQSNAVHLEVVQALLRARE
eukprot:41986-Eustigmatos_ZCMA.PRE.1